MLPGFIGFYLVLLIYTGFYLVLLIYTRFYWGFTGGVLGVIIWKDSKATIMIDEALTLRFVCFFLLALKSFDFGLGHFSAFAIPLPPHVFQELPISSI